MIRHLLFFSLCIVVLTGCVNREQADLRLAEGCAAGVETLLPDGVEIDKVVSHEGSEAAQGASYRHITLKAVEKGDWLEEEKEYICIFEESFGFLNTNYTAAIYQIRVNGRVIGKSGGEILGDAQDFIKLTDAIREAMY